MKKLFPATINFTSKFYISLIAVSTFLLLAGLALISGPKNLDLYQMMQNRWSYFLNQGAMLNKSSLDLKVGESFLYLSFDVSEDQEAELFFNKLGVSDEIIKDGIVLEIDPSLKDKLERVLPTKLYLEFEENKVSFKNQKLPSLSSGAAKETIEISTGSGRLNLGASGDGNLNLEVQDPLTVINYASSTGQLNLSKKLEYLFPSINQIDRIKLEIDGKSVSGEIILK